MKKAAIILSLVCVMALGLSGCGGGSGGGGGSSKTQAVDVGDFTVEVPGGWLVMPQTDMFGEKDADGNYPVKTDAIGFGIGAKSELDALSKPCVYVYYYPTVTAEKQAESTKSMVDYLGETTDLDPITVNGKECICFETKQESFLDETKFYVSIYVFYPINDTDTIQFNIPVSGPDYEGVTLEDAGVQAMMESVALK